MKREILRTQKDYMNKIVQYLSEIDGIQDGLLYTLGEIRDLLKEGVRLKTEQMGRHNRSMKDIEANTKYPVYGRDGHLGPCPICGGLWHPVDISIEVHARCLPKTPDNPLGYESPKADATRSTEPPPAEAGSLRNEPYHCHPCWNGNHRDCWNSMGCDGCQDCYDSPNPMRDIDGGKTTPQNIPPAANPAMPSTCVHPEVELGPRYDEKSVLAKCNACGADQLLYPLDEPPKAADAGPHAAADFPDCAYCAPCCVCDDECGCIPGPCAMCGHSKPPKADTSASEAKRETASESHPPIKIGEQDVMLWCNRCQGYRSEGHIKKHWKES